MEKPENLVEVKIFKCKNGHAPTKEEYEWAWQECKERHLFIELTWFVPYSGNHSRYISEDTTREELDKLINERIIYGL